MVFQLRFTKNRIFFVKLIFVVYHSVSQEMLVVFSMRETCSECKHAKLDFIEPGDNDQRFMMLRFYCWRKVHGGGRFVNIS